MKRTELKRKTLLRASGPAKTSMRILKTKICSKRLGGCGEQFRPWSSTQKACCVACSISMTKVEKDRQERQAASEDKRQTRARLEALKTIPQLKKEAQREFNRYVRLRDAGKGCFVCGTTLVLGGVGGGFDAGHIRSRSNADNLRFDERNVHGQCKSCNAVGATKDWEMRGAAVRLLGPVVAAELYADNKPVKWTREQLREIRDTYRAKARELEKQ